MRVTGVRRCIACRSPFDSSNKEATLCRYCENALERMNGYVVPVDKIQLHHIQIDKDGIPEVKLQFGERILILRRENDPLDVVEVVHGRWTEAEDGDGAVCSVCGEDFCHVYLEVERFLYCPNCGAKMDGD